MPNFAADAVPPTVMVAVGLFAVSVMSPLAVFTVPVHAGQTLDRGLQLRERRDLTGPGTEGDGLRGAAADRDGQGLALRHGALRQQIGRLERVLPRLRIRGGGIAAGAADGDRGRVVVAGENQIAAAVERGVTNALPRCRR